MKQKARPKKKERGARLLRLLPLILAAGYLPLLTHTVSYENGLEGYDWFPAGQEVSVDLFLAVKLGALLVLGIWAAVGSVLLLRKGKRPGRIFLPLGVYAVLVLLSGLFSAHRLPAFAGSYHLFESVPAVLSYLALCLYASLALEDGEDLRLLWNGIWPGMALVLCIGVLQLLGLDPFRWTFVKALITSPSLWGNLDAVQFKDDGHTVYSTLFNPDYVLPYGCFAVGTALAAGFCVRERKKRTGFLLLAGAGVLCIAGSGSRTALFAVPVALVVGLLCRFGRISTKEKRRGLAVGLGVVLVLGVFVSQVHGGPVRTFRRLLRDISGKDPAWAVTEVRTLEDRAEVQVNGRTLSLSYQVDGTEGWIDLTDETGEPAEGTVDGTGKTTLTDPDFAGAKARLVRGADSQVLLYLKIDGTRWYFAEREGGYYDWNAAGKYVKLHEVENAHLFPERFLNWRGSLWNRTIPLLRTRILLGSGAGTFLYVYPQDDELYKSYRYKSRKNLIEVKPHSLFLQQWVDHGLAALLAFLAFFGWFLAGAFRTLRRAPLDRPEGKMASAIFLGTVCYLTAGLTTDSNLCTAPAAWVWIGVGIALCDFMKGEKN